MSHNYLKDKECLLETLVNKQRVFSSGFEFSPIDLA